MQRRESSKIDAGEDLCVTVRQGDTIWGLAESVYGPAHHPLAAIYEENHLLPRVTLDHRGKRAFVPPVIHAGVRILFPAPCRIQPLQHEFFANLNHTTCKSSLDTDQIKVPPSIYLADAGAHDTRAGTADRSGTHCLGRVHLPGTTAGDRGNGAESLPTGDSARPGEPSCIGSPNQAPVNSARPDEPSCIASPNQAPVDSARPDEPSCIASPNQAPVDSAKPGDTARPGDSTDGGLPKGPTAAVHSPSAAATPQAADTPLKFTTRIGNVAAVLIDGVIVGTVHEGIKQSLQDPLGTAERAGTAFALGAAFGIATGGTGFVAEAIGALGVALSVSAGWDFLNPFDKRNAERNANISGCLNTAWNARDRKTVRSCDSVSAEGVGRPGFDFALGMLGGYSGGRMGSGLLCPRPVVGPLLPSIGTGHGGFSVPNLNPVDFELTAGAVPKPPAQSAFGSAQLPAINERSGGKRLLHTIEERVFTNEPDWVDVDSVRELPQDKVQKLPMTRALGRTPLLEVERPADGGHLLLGMEP